MTMRSNKAADTLELERRLIQSARLDNRPAPAAVRRQILGAVNPLLGAASTAGALTASRALASVAPKAAALGGATASVKLLGGSLIVKCALGTLLAGAFAAGTYHTVTHTLSATRALAVTQQVPAGTAATRRERAEPTQKTVPPEPVAPVDEGATSPAPPAAPAHDSTPSAIERSRPTASAGVERKSTALGAEVALLDRARTALAAGNGALAIKVLDEHQRSYKSGHLMPEAAYLRVQALLKTGNQAAARDVAAHAQATWPESPLSSELGALANSPARP